MWLIFGLLSAKNWRFLCQPFWQHCLQLVAGLVYALLINEIVKELKSIKEQNYRYIRQIRAHCEDTKWADTSLDPGAIKTTKLS